MLDIIFISYDEPNAEYNWKRLISKFPYAKRINGVRGIANAHTEANKIANTSFFYVVDGDAYILDSFKFDYRPPNYDKQYVHIWKALNPALGISYGYGGVKIFNKSQFKNIKNALDFSTTLSSGIKLFDEVACITKFNSDPVRAYRGAFRESIKLCNVIHDKNKDKNEIDVAKYRLNLWLNPISSCYYREEIVAGTQDGISKFSISKLNDLSYINDHTILSEIVSNNLTKSFPEVDQSITPITNSVDNMKNEFFFITKIMSSLYDKHVNINLGKNELRDALSDGQLYSKMWLINEFKNILNKNILEHKDTYNVAILGGWLGLLSLLFFTHELPVSITSIDIDERCNLIASSINSGFDFIAKTEDMYNTNYNNYDIIINTSSEHISNIEAWRLLLPKNKLLFVQNNDFLDGDGHISNVENSQQLRNMLKLEKVYYEGTKVFPQYSRFMVVGLT